MELLQPVERVGDEEVPDLLAPEVEDVRAPVGVLPARGVRVLVERRAVEAGQREVVLGEVRRHPVHEDPDAGLVQPVDEVAQAVRVTEAGGGGVVRGDLVAPRAAEGVLHDRQELHVGEAGLLQVGDQLVGQLGVRLAAAPRAEVHLVDRHRLLVGCSLLPAPHPLVVVPGVGGLEDDRRLGGGHLRGVGHRVGLLPPGVVGPQHDELVARARAGPGDEQLPHPGDAELAHRVLTAVPAVEVALHAQALGVRRPDGEGGAGDRPAHAVVGAARAAPSTDHSCSCLPSLMRCRSTSPSVGR